MMQSIQKNVQNKKASFICILAKSNHPSTNPAVPIELYKVLLK